MDATVTLLMATMVRKGELPKEPFYIKDKMTEEIIDVLGGEKGDSKDFLFETARGSKSKTLDLARRSVEFKAKRKVIDLTIANNLKETGQEPAVIQFVINESNFPILSGSIKGPDGKTFKSVMELYFSNIHEVMVDSVGLTAEQARSLNLTIGKPGPENKFVYKDFVSSRQGIEGNSSPNIEG